MKVCHALAGQDKVRESSLSGAQEENSWLQRLTGPSISSTSKHDAFRYRGNSASKARVIIPSF